jgi:hypothetical protein
MDLKNKFSPATHPKIFFASPLEPTRWNPHFDYIPASASNMKTCPKKGSANPRESIKHWVGVTADDIPPGWIDDMVKRLFEIVNRDMIRLEGVQLAESDKDPDGQRKEAKDPKEVLDAVAQRQRLATEIRRNLEKLSALETKRAQPRKTERRKKVAISNDDSLAELERRIAQLAAAGRAPEDSGKSES